MFILGTSLVESMNAAANIFLGAGMTPFLLKPYLKSLSLSELHSVLASGFATVAANLMVAYISFGISASHLLSARYVSNTLTVQKGSTREFQVSYQFTFQLHVSASSPSLCQNALPREKEGS